MSDKYSHDIDVSSQNEPDYMARFEKPIVLPDYELWLDTQEPTIEDMEKQNELNG